MSTFHEWNEYLGRFNKDGDEHLAQHLKEFHECIEQHGITYEDTLMKLFFYSLEEDAHDRYKPYLVQAL